MWLSISYPALGCPKPNIFFHSFLSVYSSSSIFHSTIIFFLSSLSRSRPLFPFSLWFYFLFYLFSQFPPFYLFFSCIISRIGSFLIWMILLIPSNPFQATICDCFFRSNFCFMQYWLIKIKFFAPNTVENPYRFSSLLYPFILHPYCWPNKQHRRLRPNFQNKNTNIVWPSFINPEKTPKHN